jgi:hypothetical protein
MRITGIIMILLGALLLTIEGISYKTEEKVLDVGPIEATAERTRTVPINPIIASLVLGGGVLLVVLGSRRPQEV